MGQLCCSLTGLEVYDLHNASPTRSRDTSQSQVTASTPMISFNRV